MSFGLSNKHARVIARTQGTPSNSLRRGKKATGATSDKKYGAVIKASKAWEWPKIDPFRKRGWREQTVKMGKTAQNRLLSFKRGKKREKNVGGGWYSSLLKNKIRLTRRQKGSKMRGESGSEWEKGHDHGKAGEILPLSKY